VSEAQNEDEDFSNDSDSDELTELEENNPPVEILAPVAEPKPDEFKIAKISIEDGDTRIDPWSRITVDFLNYGVYASSVDGRIKLVANVPDAMPHPLEVKSDYKRIMIAPKTPLLPNTEYVLTVDSGIKNFVDGRGEEVGTKESVNTSRTFITGKSRWREPVEEVGVFSSEIKAQRTIMNGADDIDIVVLSEDAVSWNHFDSVAGEWRGQQKLASRKHKIQVRYNFAKTCESRHFQVVSNTDGDLLVGWLEPRKYSERVSCVLQTLFFDHNLKRWGNVETLTVGSGNQDDVKMPALEVDDAGNRLAIWHQVKDVGIYGQDVYWSYKTNSDDKWLPYTPLTEKHYLIKSNRIISKGNGQFVAIAYHNVGRLNRTIQLSFDGTKKMWTETPVLYDKTDNDDVTGGLLQIEKTTGGMLWAQWVEINRATAIDTYFVAHKPVDKPWSQPRIIFERNHNRVSVSQIRIVPIKDGNLDIYWYDNPIRDSVVNEGIKSRRYFLETGEFSEESTIRSPTDPDFALATTTSRSGSILISWRDQPLDAYSTLRKYRFYDSQSGEFGPEKFEPYGSYLPGALHVSRYSSLVARAGVVDGKYWVSLMN